MVETLMVGNGELRDEKCERCKKSMRTNVKGVIHCSKCERDLEIEAELII